MFDISAFVLTQNNAATIAACLNSLGWCDQVVVIDSYSNDGTLEIVARYPNAAVYQHEYTNAREQRIWGMPHVSTKWVFIIDSDEICPPLLRDKIITILKSGSEEYDGYRFLIRTIFMGRLLKHRDYISSFGKRLVLTRIATRYKEEASVHASIRLDNMCNVPGKYYLIHDPIRGFQQQLAKMVRYAKWQAEDMHKKGKLVHWWHFTLRPAYKFITFYLGRGGFRDGIPGLVISILAGWSVFLKYLMLKEMCLHEKAR